MQINIRVLVHISKEEVSVIIIRGGLLRLCYLMNSLDHIMFINFNNKDLILHVPTGIQIPSKIQESKVPSSNYKINWTFIYNRRRQFD